MKIELIGFGAEKSHNATRVFQEKTLRKPTKQVGTKTVKVNTCNRCGAEVPKRWRYCSKCKAVQKRESNRRSQTRHRHKKLN